MPGAVVVVMAGLMLVVPVASASAVIGVASWIYDGIFIGALMTREMLRTMALSVAIYAVALVVLMWVLGDHGLWAALMVLNGARCLTMRAVFPAVLGRVSAAAA